MSAICGILRFDGEDVAAGAVARMTRRMSYRGPDGIETIELGRLALGHCLMHVNREDVYEAQPIVERDAVLVADCRIDNREALAAELGISSNALAAMPDSVVLLNAWRHWGDDVAAHLLGDFAFAIFDRAAGTLLIGRDHMGQRQVYYHAGEEFFVFATEVGALFDAGGVPRRINEQEVARRLFWSTVKHPGETIYAGVALLPGGSTLRINAAGGSTLAAYWQPRAGDEHVARDDAHYVAVYRATIEEAVACRVRRLIAPPALAFSGGFDSGIIAAVAAPIVANGGKLIAVASVLAEDDPERDARPAVETFRGRPGLDIHYFVRGAETNYDDPEAAFAESGGMAQRTMARDGIHAIARRCGARLVMDGHGGDYTVNVYDTQWLGAMLKRGDFGRFAREFRAKLRFTGKRPRSALRSDVLPSLTPNRVVAWALAAKQGFAPSWRRRGISRDFAARALAAGTIDRTQLNDGHPLRKHGPARMLKMLRQVAMGAPGQGSPAARAGLDLTRPFHDKRIVELGLAIPESLQFRDGRDRWLARTVFANRLPRRMIERQLPNDREQPDLFRMMREAAPRLLAETRALDRDSTMSRYVDLAVVERLLARGGREHVKRDRIRTAAAVRTLMIARFVAWVDRSNA
ncbi:asparagine synthase-related protein [Sphingomonas sp.]|jgi:asparagine synthase (glutamine-hydrolysing)|uniref:asparagine synthase-related protein n=1 Tax=Sphingomonas sp. TaxID=28214 RepID=UPI002E336462|nr:asparagine synthase-related protein [Sphingomonas sp.]HEX4695937.1 asparagine synthase-related protein [Sphingomonas sp.]